MLRFLLAVLCVLSCALAAPRPLSVRTRGGGRIVGGTAADIADYPWTAFLQDNGYHYCGASLVSLTWVLTACQCVYDSNIALFFITAATSERDSGGVHRAVSSAVMHGSFNPNSLDYDIALLQLDRPVPISHNLRPVGLAGAGYDPPVGLEVTLTGWGRIGTSGIRPTRLRNVDISIIDRASCVARFGITDRMICAGEAGRSFCDGDSGAPLVHGGTMQVGIASWSRATCEEDGGVYTNVGSFRSWIDEAMYGI